ncbi:MAG: winged helix-turn-helix transcriptional regulator [Anaerolineales bacterium]|nr:winged helix-turn-helix transcriptional regulator [Anaerolineales bacterium]
MPNWTFITNHGAVLALVSQHGQITTREIAERIGITERSVQRIIADLVKDGYILKGRHGRLNVYEIDREQPLRHITQRDLAVRDLLSALGQEG